MFDPQKILDQVLGGPNPQGKGGMAALGAIANRVWSNWRAGQRGQPSAIAQSLKEETCQAEGTPFLPDNKTEREDLSRTLLSAMICAAKADGHIDAAEQTRIFRKIDEADLSAEEKNFLLEELRRPLDADALAAKATTPERALEIYAASLLAIDTEGTAEREYLDNLAQKLKLDPSLAQKIEDETMKPAA